MEFKSAIMEAFKELIVPEFDGIKAEIRELRSAQEQLTKRLDEQKRHLADPNRRIDEVKIAMNKWNDRINTRLDRQHEAILKRQDQEELIKFSRNLDIRLKKLEEKVAGV